MLCWKGQTIEPDKFKVGDKINTRLHQVRFKYQGHRYVGVQVLANNRLLVRLDKLKKYFGLAVVGTVVVKYNNKYRIIYNVSDLTLVSVESLQIDFIRKVYERYVIWAHVLDLKINLSMFRDGTGRIICIGELEGFTKDTIIKYLPAESVIQEYVNCILKPNFERIRNRLKKYPELGAKIVDLENYYS